MMYNKLVESCFFTPQHVGVLDLSEPLSVCYCSERWGQRGIFDFYLLCNETGRVKKAYFKAHGSPYLVAAAEWVCQQLEGSLIDEHPQFNYSALMQKLSIPDTRYSVALQIEDAYRELVTMMQAKLKRGNDE